jgi:hypothetical protein
MMENLKRFGFTECEIAVIDGLAARLEVSRLVVLRQGLRMFQAVQEDAAVFAMKESGTKLALMPQDDPPSGWCENHHPKGQRGCALCEPLL